MTATARSLLRLREHARNKVTEVAASEHNPDCLCGNRLGALTGWAALPGYDIGWRANPVTLPHIGEF